MQIVLKKVYKNVSIHMDSLEVIKALKASHLERSPSI
ncbi:hypothetical protein Goshw_012700, partial [Gossypium schwendimanii]|nr:hypothetical protein [Gossypium schwendimanii]